ncbi:MAG: peptidoglycan editing factor PgeF [Clostridia bacterium]|jgi:YfiH family protein|nr:peptidoglycan editing factor PgeF [Clostridia bacterium]
MKDLSNEHVVHVKKDGIEYLQFRRLLKYSNIINHAYSLGIDREYSTNTSDIDKYEEIIKNYDELCTAIGIDYRNLVKTNQTHTKNVICINEKINKETPDFNLKQYNDIDGSTTDKRNLILTTTNADCILLLFFDPVKKAIANVHSGWRGTLQKISVQAIKKMEQEYNSDPKDIICCICPSIRECHFEVDKDVQEPYYNEFKELEGIDKLILHDKERNKWNIDTVGINKEILKLEGLKEENIIDSGICSVCNSDIIHSYRAKKENSGRAIAIIELK